MVRPELMGMGREGGEAYRGPQGVGGRKQGRKSMNSLSRLPKLSLNVLLHDFRQLGLGEPYGNPEPGLPILQVQTQRFRGVSTC